MSALGVLYALVPYMDEDVTPEIDPFFRVAYGTLHRAVWAAALGWVVIACARGYGGIANWILSSPIFIPLSRMSYVVFLIHNNLIKAHFSRMRMPFYSQFSDHLMNFIAILMVSYILSAIVTLLVEIPCLNLDQLYFASSAKSMYRPIRTLQIKWSIKLILNLLLLQQRQLGLLMQQMIKAKTR